MSSRAISAITVIVCVPSLAVEGFAIAADDVKTKSLSLTKAESNLDQYEPPPGLCIDGLAPENCAEPVGCTAKRMSEIDERAADGGYADFLGIPIGGDAVPELLDQLQPLGSRELEELLAESVVHGGESASDPGLRQAAAAFSSRRRHRGRASRSFSRRAASFDRTMSASDATRIFTRSAAAVARSGIV
jgi:hypothetical protein